MSRIIFINPGQNLEDIYGSLSKEASRLPPLGLGYLANSIRSIGHEARIIDASCLDISNQKAASLALEWGARYVGIAATTDTIFQAGRIADSIKSRSKDVMVIIGGPHITAVPEETLKVFNSFDFGVIGEGEETLKDLINSLESGKGQEDIKGIAYRSGGRVDITAPRDFIKDLDKLPFPAWELFPDISRFYRPAALNYKQLPSTSLVTSRGCPGRCAFCDTRVFGSRCRIHSARYVLESIRYLKKNYGIKDICFYDDVFTVFKKRLSDLCRGLRDRRTKVSWSCQARVNVVDYEMLRMMKESGCWKISFGIESASDSILRLMNKNTTLEQAKKAVSLAKRAGLEVEGYFILGFFGEDRDSLRATKEFIMDSDLDAVLLSYFLPYPGAPAYPDVGKYGRFNEDWENMNAIDTGSPPFVPYSLSAKELRNAQNEIYKGFYFRPKIFLKYVLKTLKNPSCAARLLRSSWNFTRFAFGRNCPRRG